MTDAYVYTNATNAPDAFDVVANALTVARLRRDPDAGWRMESVSPLVFGSVDFDANLDADEAQGAAVEWIRAHQSDEVDEFFD